MIWEIFIRWKTTSMEDDLNGQKQLEMSQTLFLVQYIPKQTENWKIEDDFNLNSMEDDLNIWRMEDDLNILAKRKTTSIYFLNVVQPQIQTSTICAIRQIIQQAHNDKFVVAGTFQIYSRIKRIVKRV